MKKIKLIALNTIIESICYVITAIVGLLKIKYFISFLGSDINGYYQVINNFVVYLFMVEVGLSNAILFKMYKPIADKNEIQIARQFNGAKKIMRGIGLLIIGLMIVASPFLYYYFQKSKMALTFVLCFVLLVFGQALGYLCNTKAYVALLSANQERHVHATVYNFSKILTDVFTIVLLYFVRNILVVVLINFVFKLSEAVIINAVTKKKYPYLNITDEVDMSAKNMSKDLVVHQFGSVINSNIDSFLLLSFSGPIGALYVSIYASYNYIVNFLKELMTKNNNIFTNIFGVLLSSDDENSNKKLFKEYYTFFAILAIIFGICFTVGARSFVKIWIGKTEYILSYIIIVFFALEVVLNLLIKPLTSMISAAGLFKESKYYSLYESLINLALSIILIKPLGIAGVLLGTCISNLCSIIFRSYLISKKVFDKKIIIDILIINVIVYIVYAVSVVGYMYIDKYLVTNISGLFGWLGIMVGVFVITTIIILTCGYLVNTNVKSVIIKLKSFIRNTLGGLYGKFKRS